MLAWVGLWNRDPKGIWIWISSLFIFAIFMNIWLIHNYSYNKIPYITLSFVSLHPNTSIMLRHTVPRFCTVTPRMVCMSEVSGIWCEWLDLTFASLILHGLTVPAWRFVVIDGPPTAVFRSVFWCWFPYFIIKHSSSWTLSLLQAHPENRDYIT